MGSQDSDVVRVLGSLGVPDMAYRSFAVEPPAAPAGGTDSALAGEAAGVDQADPAEAFPLLVAALPGGLGPVPAPLVCVAEAVAPAPMQPVPAAVPLPPPMPVPPIPWPPQPAAPALATPSAAMRFATSPFAAVPPAPPAVLPWAVPPAPEPAPAAPVAATPLERVFRILRGGAASASPGAPAGRGLHDLFRRL